MELARLSNSEFKIKREEFENSINMKIDKDLFYTFYMNAKFFPQINSVSKDYINLKALFLKTNGKIPKAFSKLYFDKNSKIYKFESDLKIINDNLKKNGYHVIKNFISEKEIDKIKADLSYQKFYGSNKTQYDYSDLQDYDKLKGDNHYFDSRFYTEMSSQPLKKDSSLLKILQNSFFRDVAGNYFGSRPFVNFFRVIVTKAKDEKFFSNSQITAAANKFHFDYSHLRSIRFFIYLTDVTDDSGPHTFIKSSHDDNFKYPKDEINFYDFNYKKFYNGTREGILKDDWVNQNFSQSDQIKFIGKKGTLIIEDTTGLHKGSNCHNGSREVLLLNYSLSNIGNLDLKFLPVIEDSKNIEDSDVNYSFSEKSREDLKENKFNKKKPTFLRKVKKKILAKSKNYLI